MSAAVSPMTTPVEIARAKNRALQNDDAATAQNEREQRTTHYSRNYAQENVDNINYV